MGTFSSDIDRLTGYARRRILNAAIVTVGIVMSLCITFSDACATEVLVQDEYAELVMDPPTEEERAQVYQAVARCAFRTKAHLVDHWKVLALVRLEERLSIPAEGRGILPAIWCIEASLMIEFKGALIRGDYREGRGYISQGPFQLSEGLAKGCGGTPDDRHDLIWAARCWVHHVHRVYPRVQKQCKRRAWVVAEALISNPRKYAGNCEASSKHYKLLGK